MRRFFLIQAIIVVLGVMSLLLVRNNVRNYGLLVTGDETAVASLPATLSLVYALSMIAMMRSSSGSSSMLTVYNGSFGFLFLMACTPIGFFGFYQHTTKECTLQ